MLNCIQDAKHSIVLSSYIFDYDSIGKQFINVLGDAHKRGVQIRVLIDGIGIGYSFSWTKTDFALHRLGIATARFLPTLSRHGTRFINLRNHRKILSIDGKEAFIGGINIRDGNMLDNAALPLAKKIRDVHFKVRGPVINQINALFAEDWLFATSEALALPTWAYSSPGNTICRVIPDGPDDNYHKLQLTLINALNTAVNSIKITTPYFLPDAILLKALELASRRGVTVEVIVPRRSNIRVVDWAFQAQCKYLLESDVRIMLSPEPFDHTKLLLIDNKWCLIGSSNWDARSLELNFEVNLECYESNICDELNEIFNEKKASSAIVTKKQLADKSIPQKFRNNFFKLFLPYL